MDINILQNANGSKSIYPIIQYNEEWRPIEYDNIKPIYWISNYGRIYSMNTKAIMEPKINNCGYLEIGLWRNDGVKKFYLIHRLVMIIFNPIEGFEELSVNHINGCKFDNRIWNLEWLSIKENIHHAFDAGLRKRGEDLSYTIYTNDQIHAVCKAMEDGKSSFTIAKEVFNSELTRPLMGLFRNIYHKIQWIHISDKYNIRNFPRNNTFSDPQVEIICKLLESNPNISNNEILDNLGLICNNPKDRAKYLSTIKGIRKKKFYKRITSNYNI